jgi:hypothetical protein
MNRIILKMVMCAFGLTMTGISTYAADESQEDPAAAAKQERVARTRSGRVEVGQFSAPAPPTARTPTAERADQTPPRRLAGIRRTQQDASEAENVNAGSARGNAATGEPKPATNPGGPEGLSFHDRIVRLVTAQQALANQIGRLQAKRAALLRWDRPTQERFLQVFGTTSGEARARVAKRLDQLIEQKLQLLAANAEQVNLERFLEQK